MFEAAAVFTSLTFSSVAQTLSLLVASVRSTVVPFMLVDDGVMTDQVTIDDLLLHDGEIIEMGVEEQLLDNVTVVFIMVDILVSAKLVLVWFSGMLKIE